MADHYRRIKAPISWSLFCSRERIASSGVTRASMRPLNRPALISSLAMCLAFGAAAQDRSPDLAASNAASLPSNTPAALTGKERLGRKWMDEQRIDNCKVPIEKRGTRPRPGTCPHIPMG